MNIKNNKYIEKKSCQGVERNKGSKYICQASKGFTLIEMLVVVGMIAVLLGVGVNSIKGLSESKGVSVGVPNLKAVFSLARQIAINDGVETDVVIVTQSSAADRDGPVQSERLERAFRYVAIAQGDVERSKPILLPNNCYLDIAKSNSNGMRQMFLPHDIGRSIVQYWRFNSLGFPTAVTATDGGADVMKVVLSAGEIRFNGGEFELNTSTDGQTDSQGFILTKFGEFLDIKDRSNL